MGRASRRLAVCEALFDAYQFGWDVEEVHHWCSDEQGDRFFRAVLFCGVSPCDPCIPGYFHVRFLPRRTKVDECYAIIDGCLIGQDPNARLGRRRR
jgi:hypothetical protein